jgi:hypothetical protein
MNKMYTEYTPYNYCNNSPMMFRDPSGMSMEIALVETGMDLFNYVYGMFTYGADFLYFGYESNSVYPVRGGAGGGGGSGVTSKNGVSAFTIFCHSLLKQFTAEFNGDDSEGSAADIVLGYSASGNNSSNGGGYTNNKNTFSNTKKSGPPSPSAAMGNLNRAFTPIQTMGSSFSLVYPTYLSNRAEESLAIIYSTPTGAKMLGDIDFYLKHFQISARITINSYMFISAICTECTFGKIAIGLTQYNFDESSETSSPVIYLSALAYLNGFVKVPGYLPTYFLDLFIHELGHLHHFLSTMYHFQVNSELVSAWDVWRYWAFRKEDYANQKMESILLEIKNK